MLALLLTIAIRVIAAILEWLVRVDIRRSEFLDKHRCELGQLRALCERLVAALATHGVEAEYSTQVVESGYEHDDY